MEIQSQFEAGNIVVEARGGPGEATLSIRPDAGEDHFQWFYFRVAGMRGQPCRLRIRNAGEASFPKGWEDYQVCASVDRMRWFRVATAYENGELVITHTPDSDFIWFAYFAPYSLHQLEVLLGKCQGEPGFQVFQIGTTVDGRPLDRVQWGEGPLQYWILARQHPGETMASWWMEGFLNRLFDARDSAVQALFSATTLHVIPHMNPDGGFRGHLRNNAAGMNLNRAWAEPDLKRSPEVLYTRNAMDQTGVDFCLDVHGDEGLPYVFLSGPEGIPDETAHNRMALCHLFRDAYVTASGELQTRFGYPIAPPGTANMTLCTKAVAHRFNCPAYTLEMPFKDNANAPDVDCGWSPERSMRLGASTVPALLALARAQEAEQGA